MRLARRRFLAHATAIAAAAALVRAQRPPAPRRFEIAEDGFRLDGRPIVLRSGSMHYPRVPRPYWRSRLRWLRALGLNTLCTYVFWNLHEPRPGRFDFSGDRDLAAYLRAAHDEGLLVILRPGPYVCTEWDFGGFPAWLLAPPAMRVRTSDPRFLAASARYFRRLGRELRDLQITRGGPIALVQVENEYGSFGDDHAYMAAIRDQIRAAGFEVPLYTADGPDARLLAGGTLAGLPCAINFGDGDAPAEAFATLARVRPTGPRMCGEYWDGWFDHWGERHHTTPPRDAAGGLEWLLAHGCSVNLYMAHGGTSFGFMAGANFGRAYQPDTTSYDYDAPLDESGRPTSKFFALREVYRRHLPTGETLPALPPVPRLVALPAFDLAESAPLEQLLAAAPLRRSRRPLPMEALGQNFGFVWYRTVIPAPASGRLVLTELRDYARVYQNGRLLGTLDRSLGEAALAQGLAVTLAAGRLDIVVECICRINFGRRLQDNLQGITAGVTLAGRDLENWEMFSLPLEDLSRLRFSPADATAPAFHRGTFVPAAAEDTFLDLSRWGKGMAWVNGRNLGRFWNRGPQQSLYLPGCWLRPGGNEAVVLDWDPVTAPRLAGVPKPVFATRLGGIS